MYTPQALESTIGSQLLAGLLALRRGDFSFRLPHDLVGLDGKIADTYNDVASLNERMARELQTQQRELQQTNEQLQEKAKLLAEQNVEVERKNEEVEHARQALEEKARQLALTSKFKSEFLAHMSHELRTPLNSLLMLSDQLSKNPSGNLTPKQVEFAQTIHASGNDLLTLINDILDLSKIESGTVVVDIEDYGIEDLQRYVERTFRHVAEAQRLDFRIDVDPSLPRIFQTDPKRLQQVVKNLLSNACKFTERGSVSLRIAPVRSGWNADHHGLSRARSVLAISVSDTGIGIPPEKQHVIFEAFQQADGSTSRNYGGTGLGLAICRELTRLLGGDLGLVSNPGRGSTFTLYLPLRYPARGRRSGAPADRPAAALPLVPAGSAPAVEPPPAAGMDDAPGAYEDDRQMVQPDDRVLLIADNDLRFARFLLDVARERGFKGIITGFGAAALALARGQRVDAMTLDIRLPDIDGWRVLENLKRDLRTRHIPVHVITTEEEQGRGRALGAVGVLTKPVAIREVLEGVLERLEQIIRPDPKTVLVVAASSHERHDLLALLEGPDLVMSAVGSWPEARSLLRQQQVDCLVVHASAAETVLPRLASTARNGWHGPTCLVVFAPNPLSARRERDTQRIAERATVHTVHAPDGLVDAVALALHQRFESLPPARRELLETLYRGDAMLEGHKVLIVDDDIRNIFAMTSVLERHGMTVIPAETGKEAIDRLQATPDIDIVLMDIMMPGMDGYDTIRAIRRNPAFRSLPIIAITAKAMKGDREKCLEAGAWDHLPKPVDAEQLLAVLRTWIDR